MIKVHSFGVQQKKKKENAMEEETFNKILSDTELKLKNSDYNIDTQELWNSCAIVEEELIYG